MDLTPPEQAGELAVATKCTGEPEEAVPGLLTLALAGDETQTPAKDGSETDTNRQRIACSFPTLITSLQLK
jgi:hypothetical protein